LKFIKGVENISSKTAKRLSIPKVKEEDVKLLARRSANNVNVATNPGDFSLGDIEAIIPIVIIFK